MSFPSRVERWRHLVDDLAGDLPVDLVLGIVWHESGGQAGILGRGKTKCAQVPTSTGSRRACHAFGLMQVIPGNVRSWNKQHPDQAVTYEEMTGSSEAAARVQLQLGIAILRSSLAWLERYGFPWPGGALSHEQVKIGLMVYAWGAGHLEPYLDELRDLGAPITAGELAARWPDLGAPKNRPLRFSRVVYNKVYGGGVETPAPAPKKKTGRSGCGGGLAIAALLLLATSRRKR